MSLMMLGPVAFDLALNPQSISRSGETPFAVHDVIGAAPLREFMGDGDRTIEIAGVIHPYHFGGLAGLAALELARQAHTPLPCMLGTLVPLGWVLIEKLSSEDSDIGQFGVGTEVQFTASLVRVDTPEAGMAGAIMSIFL